MSELAIAYTHTPWIEQRRAAMRRLMAQVEAERSNGGGFTRWAERCFNERMPNHVWSDLMWRWALEQNTSHALFLQDDVILAPQFFLALRSMLEGAPAFKVIALHIPMPRARDAFRKGERWLFSTDGLVGCAYVLAHEALEDFLAWKDTKLKPGACERTTEDSLIDAWAYDAEIPIAHPIPTIIDHDLSIASTYGNEMQSERRPLVTWRDRDVLDGEMLDLWTPRVWSPPASINPVRHFPKSHWMLRTLLADERRAQELAMTYERTPFVQSPWCYP